MSTCLIPCPESSPTPSHLPNPCMRKYRFQNKSFLFSKTHYRISVKYWTTLRGELLDISPKQSWVRLRDDLLNNSPRHFFGKSSVKIPFTIMFHFCFISCHALTPNFLGCPSAHGMHYAFSKPLMLIFTCIY